jgi:cytochrome P450
LDLISGGTETSATAVEWAMAELVQQPKIMQKLQNELDAVIGPNRVVEESDLPNLPFLLATVKETFRLHPPAALNLPRESSHEFSFRGYRSVILFGAKKKAKKAKKVKK